MKPAVTPDKPFNIPSKLMILLTGAVMGLILGVVLVFLAEVFDTSMGTIARLPMLRKGLAPAGRPSGAGRFDRCAASRRVRAFL